MTKKENQNYFLQLETKKQTASSYFDKTEQTPDWHNSTPEGELAVDVMADDQYLIIVSTMAGAVTEKVSVNIHNDLLTIRGERNLPVSDKKDLELYHRECYWGPFSRTVVLPVDIKAEMSYAEYKNGILKVFIPREDAQQNVPINIIEN